MQSPYRAKAVREDSILRLQEEPTCRGGAKPITAQNIKVYFWGGVCTQPGEIRPAVCKLLNGGFLYDCSRGWSVLRIMGKCTSRVCDGHEEQVRLWNIHPFRHRLQQLLRRDASVDPDAEERVHGDVHMAQRCE